MFHTEVSMELKLTGLLYILSVEKTLCSVTGVWCPRSKPTACCHPLVLCWLCWHVNFNWDDALGVLVYSSECVWIQVPVRPNEWKHRPRLTAGSVRLWQTVLRVFEAVVSVPHSNLGVFFCFFSLSLFSSIMDPSQVLSSYHTKLHLHLLHRVPGG